MTPGINLQQTLSRTMLAVGDEPQLVYVLLEAHAEGVAQQLPKLPLNLCLVLDRSSSMRWLHVAAWRLSWQTTATPNS
jgi:hypothetical protein